MLQEFLDCGRIIITLHSLSFNIHTAWYSGSLSKRTGRHQSEDEKCWKREYRTKKDRKGHAQNGALEGRAEVFCTGMTSHTLSRGFYGDFSIAALYWMGSGVFLCHLIALLWLASIIQSLHCYWSECQQKGSTCWTSRSWNRKHCTGNFLALANTSPSFCCWGWAWLPVPHC